LYSSETRVCGWTVAYIINMFTFKCLCFFTQLLLRKNVCNLWKKLTQFYSLKANCP
jgi:hypothetical protein